MSICKTITVALLASSAYATQLFACPLVGDSFVFGTGDERNENRGGYVLRLARTFSSSEVNNFGYPGITTAKLLSYYKQLFAKEPRNSEIKELGTSDIVIIDVGRNDYFNRNSSTLTATTIKRLTTVLSTELMKKYGTAPLFISTVLPLTRREIDLGFIEQVNTVLLKLRGRELPAFLRFDKLSPLLLGADGLHPTSAGYDVLANIAIQHVKGDAQVRSRNSRKDLDEDGLYDLLERKKFKTSPRKRDTDEDGLIDGAEIFTQLTDPLNADTDGDGITDGVEVLQGSDPKVPDTAVPTPMATPPTI
jgi:lysophospholipase L1-like esterase